MALTVHYIASDGTDTWSNSTSSSTPCSWATMVANIAAGDHAKVKSGTYDLSGGAVTISATGPWIVQGVGSSWEDIAATPASRPVLDNGAATTDMLTISGAQGVLRDVILKSTASSGTGDGLRIITGGQCVIERCCAYGWYNNGFELAVNYGIILACEAYDCNKAGTASKGGFMLSNLGWTLIDCVAHNVNASSANGHGFIVSGSVPSCVFFNCIADTCGGHGFFHVGRTSFYLFYHCESYNCTGRGFNLDSNTYVPCAVAVRCNGIDNGTAQYQTVQAASLFIIEGSFSKGTRVSDAGRIQDESSGSTFANVPYTDGPNGNFVLDPTNGLAGRSVAVAMPTTQGYSSSTTKTVDVGAAHHADPTQPAAANVRVGTAYNDGLTTGTLPVGGWTDGSGNLTLAKETGANARGGSGTCAKLTPTNNSAYGYWYLYVPVTASTAFTLSFYHKIASGFSGLVKCSIYDTDQTTLLNTSEAVTLTDDGAYHQFTATPATPTATGFCLVRVEVKKDAGDTTEAIYIDDISYA